MRATLFVPTVVLVLLLPAGCTAQTSTGPRVKVAWGTGLNIPYPAPRLTQAVTVEVHAPTYRGDRGHLIPLRLTVRPSERGASVSVAEEYSGGERRDEASLALDGGNLRR